jgi:hypothetical protein
MKGSRAGDENERLFICYNTLCQPKRWRGRISPIFPILTNRLHVAKWPRHFYR